MNEQLPLDQELYEAWIATYDVHGAMDNIEQERIYARARIAYERAYDELGPSWTQEIIRNAREDAGEDL